MSRRSDARARDDAGEPRWVEEEMKEESPPASTGPFAHTYAAIAATEGRRRGGHRPYGLLLLLALAGATAAVVVPLLTDDPPKRVAAPSVPHPAARRGRVSESGSAAPTVVDTVPGSPKTRLRVDETGDFAVVARGGSLRYGWTLDDRAAGTGPRWVWTPEAADVGTHTVAVTVLGPGGGVTREWKVRVRPVAQPATMAKAPVEAPQVHAPADAPAARPEPAPTTPAPPVTPAPSAQAGSSDAPPPTPAAPVETASRTPERAEPPSPLATDDETRPANASRSEDSATRRSDEAATRRPAEDGRAGARRRGTTSETARADGPRGTSADVRRWLQRWAAAWNAHDVDALGRMGQMATASDAEAVRRYLAQVTDLEVSVNVVEMRDEGERVVVRFVRRDRFRDPAGRLVEHESPPIEKVLVRTVDGFRVIPGRG